MFPINPLFLRLAILGTIAIGSFSTGYYVKDKIDKAATLETIQSATKEAQRVEDESRKKVADLQDSQARLTESYNQLKQELKNAKGKVTTVPCHITDTGVRLWNDSSTATVPKDSTGTAKEATTTSGTEDTGLTVEDLLDNKAENDEICNGLREQIEAIIKWDEDTYGTHTD